MPKKLTPTQEKLLTELERYISDTWSLRWDTLKKVCDFKSFDSTFNALLEKGYIERHDVGDFSNRFKLTTKP